EHETATEVIHLTPGGERVWNPVLAPRAPISVRVVNLDGTPAACMRVDFFRSASRSELGDLSEAAFLGAFNAWYVSAQTDAQGRVVVHLAPDRPVTASVFHPDFDEGLAIMIEPAFAPSEEPHEIVLPPLAPPGAVTGRVVD